MERLVLSLTSEDESGQPWVSAQIHGSPLADGISRCFISTLMRTMPVRIPPFHPPSQRTVTTRPLLVGLILCILPSADSSSQLCAYCTDGERKGKFTQWHSRVANPAGGGVWYTDESCQERECVCVCVSAYRLPVHFALLQTSCWPVEGAVSHRLQTLQWRFSEEERKEKPNIRQPSLFSSQFQSDRSIYPRHWPISHAHLHRTTRHNYWLLSAFIPWLHSTREIPHILNHNQHWL